MKKQMIKSAKWTSFGFMTIILLCITSLTNRFSYLDLLYLVVVVVYFVSYLMIVKKF